MSALPPKADISQPDCRVDFVPIAGSCAATKCVWKARTRLTPNQYRMCVTVFSYRIIELGASSKSTSRIPFRCANLFNPAMWGKADVTWTSRDVRTLMCCRECTPTRRRPSTAHSEQLLKWVREKMVVKRWQTACFGFTTKNTATCSHCCSGGVFDSPRGYLPDWLVLPLAGCLTGADVTIYNDCIEMLSTGGGIHQSGASLGLFGGLRWDN